MDFVRGLRPLHRCSSEIFESILCHQVLLSRSEMKKLQDWRSAAEAALAICPPPGQLPIDPWRRYVKDLVWTQYYTTEVEDQKFKFEKQRRVRQIAEQERSFLGLLTKNQIQRHKQRIIDVTKASVQLCQNLTGIGYDVVCHVCSGCVRD